jgi:hypothetical protein
MLLTQSNNWKENQIYLLTILTHYTALPDSWRATPLMTLPPQWFSALLYNHRSYSTTVSTTVGLYDSCYKMLMTWSIGRCNPLTPSHSFILSQWVVFGYNMEKPQIHTQEPVPHNSNWKQHFVPINNCYSISLNLVKYWNIKIYVVNLGSYYLSFQDDGLLGHDTMQNAAQVPRFRRNLLHPSPGMTQLSSVSTASHTRIPDF